MIQLKAKGCSFYLQMILKILGRITAQFHVCLWGACEVNECWGCQEWKKYRTSFNQSGERYEIHLFGYLPLPQFSCLYLVFYHSLRYSRQFRYLCNTGKCNMVFKEHQNSSLLCLNGKWASGATILGQRSPMSESSDMRQVSKLLLQLEVLISEHSMEPGEPFGCPATKSLVYSCHFWRTRFLQFLYCVCKLSVNKIQLKYQKNLFLKSGQSTVEQVADRWCSLLAQSFS